MVGTIGGGRQEIELGEAASGLEPGRYTYELTVTDAEGAAVNVETFTNSDMLELETLGPMTKLEPGACVEHVERWRLFRDAPLPADDADLDAYVLPKIGRAPR